LAPVFCAPSSQGELLRSASSQSLKWDYSSSSSSRRQRLTLHGDVLVEFILPFRDQ
jgi:hypothetical protein